MATPIAIPTASQMAICPARTPATAPSAAPSAMPNPVSFDLLAIALSDYLASHARSLARLNYAGRGDDAFFVGLHDPPQPVLSLPFHHRRLRRFIADLPHFAQ